MNLMTFVRLLALVVIGWTIVALGAGALGVGAGELTGSTFYMISSSLQDALPVGRVDGPARPEYLLLDRKTGEMKPLALPEVPAWSLLSVSPWRDQDGNVEAVGRWVARDQGQEEFCGLGLLRLPDLTEKNRVTLDVLPTGKPCWVPGRHGEVLFPAGDGQLYRCALVDQVTKDADGRADRNRSPGARTAIAHARPVTWESQPPGTGPIYLADPTWSPEPVLRRLVFVALSVQCRRNGRPVSLASKLWWLIMNDDGDAIVDAGRLIPPRAESLDDESNYERMPCVAAGTGGKLKVLYVTRRPGASRWRLQSATLALDPATTLPRADPNESKPIVLTEDAMSSSLVVSADGNNVYAMAASGQPVKHSIPK